MLDTDHRFRFQSSKWKKRRTSCKEKPKYCPGALPFAAFGLSSNVDSAFILSDNKAESRFHTTGNLESALLFL